jgi:4'-phosphopantetheinyl transferase
MPDLPAKPNLRRTDHHLLALYARLHCEDAAWSLALELSARLFPQTLQETIRRYRRPEDRCARILGKWLLLKALAALGCPDVSLEGLRKDSNGRPSMENCIFDFNVSHSGECVACVVATQKRVGIDLEKVRAVRIEDFRDVFASDLWSRLQSDEAEPEVFFREWTRLEAVIKADGRGMQVPTHSMQSNGDTIVFEDRIWYLREIALDAGHVCHVATAMKDAEIVVEPCWWDGTRIMNATTR